MSVLRPYQSEALASIDAAFRETNSALVVMPTGTGKTVLFAKAAELWSEGRVLILAHREELVFQAAEKVARAIGERPDIEMADLRAVDGMFGGSKAVIGSVQTVSARLRSFRPEQFGLLIVDEAHHCVPQNKSYWKIIDYFRNGLRDEDGPIAEGNPDIKLLGVTATPDRADKLAMGQAFEHVAFEYALPDAIADGWLVPIEQQYVTVEGLDFSQCRTTAGDLNQGDLEKALAGEPEIVHRVAASAVDICGNEPTLIFTVSVDHARLTADVINRYPGKRAEYIHGGTDKETRRRLLRDFADGKFRYLVGCAIFTEGFDEPSIANVVVARPTMSRALYAQIIGRGTRTLSDTLTADMDQPARLAAIAASAKPRCRVIDFVGNSGRHKLISTADILAGRHAPAAVLRAVSKAKKEGKAVNMQAAMDAAAAEIAREEAERRQREEEERRREEEWARKRKESIRAKATYHTEEVDPFDTADTRSSRSGGFSRKKGPTEKMAALLRKHGVNCDDMSFEEASRQIAALKASWSGASPTPKQIATLQKFGLPTEVSKPKAGAMIDILSARGWKYPKHGLPLSRERWALGKRPDGWAPIYRDAELGPLILSARFATEQACRDYMGRFVETGEAAKVAA